MSIVFDLIEFDKKKENWNSTDIYKKKKNIQTKSENNNNKIFYVFF